MQLDQTNIEEERDMEAEVLIEIYRDMHAKEILQDRRPACSIVYGAETISSGFHFTKCRLNLTFLECSLDKTCVIIPLKSIDLKIKKYDLVYNEIHAVMLHIGEYRVHLHNYCFRNQGILNFKK